MVYQDIVSYPVDVDVDVEVTPIKQSTVLKGHHFIVLSQKISYELILF